MLGDAARTPVQTQALGDRGQRHVLHRAARRRVVFLRHLFVVAGKTVHIDHRGSIENAAPAGIRRSPLLFRVWIDDLPVGDFRRLLGDPGAGRAVFWQDEEPSGFGETVVWRPDRGGEQPVEYLVGDRRIREFLRHASAEDRVIDAHGSRWDIHLGASDFLLGHHHILARFYTLYHTRRGLQGFTTTIGP